MAAAEEAKTLQFLPFQSTLDSGFWNELSKRKIDEYQLSEAAVSIHGLYTNSAQQGLPATLALDYSAFSQIKSLSNIHYPSYGILRNTNTIDSFKTLDKKELLYTAGKGIWDSINDGSVTDQPNLLNNFFLLTYADLKKYNYYYWFAFPALMPDQPITYESIQTVGEAFTPDQISNLVQQYDIFEKDHRNVGFFIVDDQLSVHSLAAFDSIYDSSKTVTIGFCDPGTVDGYPGWPLRNYLIYAAQHWSDKVKQLNVLCYRDRTLKGRRQIEHSLLLKNVTLPPKQDPANVPKVVGWEKNEKGKSAPKYVNLSTNMDPRHLAESAVDLNLKLMRWRILPTLDLEKAKDTKCLLLGAGTLGCNVARCLLGWGVRKITFLDSSTVSYSNPVRQSLFKFEDCKNGGAKKAAAAAESLKVIFPGVDAEGVQLLIPMPGHAVGTEPGAVEETQKSVAKLTELIRAHDAVFLLMDTRESRWLPTLLCATYSKICINAALGFDTFMVMRHGFFPEGMIPEPITPMLQSDTGKGIPGSMLGCYFCNDVVAPTNSTRDRTLDQQCTVSRPGLSMIAGASAVELLMSVIQHNEQGLAPADSNPEFDDATADSPLGLVPHQIRGFLSRFHSVLPASQRFDKCTACSDVILSSYKCEGFEFLLKVFNTPNFLEDLTGLSQLYAETLDDHIWELSDEET